MLWIIIIGKDCNGDTEYQVSDGDVGERSCSFDFKTFDEAIKYRDELNDSIQNNSNERR